MMRIVGSYFIIFFETLSVFMFFDLFRRRQESRQSDVLMLLLMTTLNFFPSSFLANKNFAWHVKFFILFVCVMTYFKPKWYKGIAGSAVVDGIIYMAYTYASGMNTYVEEVSDWMIGSYRLYSWCVILLGKQMVFLCVILFITFYKYKFSIRTVKGWFELCIFPILLSLITFSVMRAFPTTFVTEEAYMLYVIVFSLSAMDIIIYFLVSYIIQGADERERSKANEVKTRNTLERYEQDIENYRSIKQKNHEFKNHILCINAFVRDRECERLNRYIDGIKGEYLH